MGRVPLRVGLIGLGTIGGAVVRLAAQHAPDEVVFVGAVVRDDERERGPGLPPICASADTLLAAAPDVVVEAGGHDALALHGPAILRVEAALDGLLLTLGTQPALPLRPVSGTTFVAEAVNLEAHFSTGADGAAEEMIVRQRGEDLRFVRGA